jgi:isobutyryl-CoA mutase
MAIQLIINREWGLAKNENPNQDAFVIDELTELVEEAVLAEFEKLTERGDVLGAMETGYQRGKIQEESMHYEMQKHTGEYPISASTPSATRRAKRYRITSSWRARLKERSSRS